MTTEHEAEVSTADRHVATVLAGGQNGRGISPWRGGSSGSDAAPGSGTAAPAGRRGSAVAPDSGGGPVPAADAPADPWPVWARPQLLEAVSVMEQVRARARGRALATELYRGWYNPVVGRPADVSRAGRALAGTYRRAHAGSGSRVLADGIAVLDRRDAIGRDGWWRTWGDSWSPITSRQRCVRVLMSPRPSALAEFVGTVTAALLAGQEQWLLACTIDPRRLRRSGGAVLYVADLTAVPGDLLDRLRPLLRPAGPPLCLPLVPGAAMLEYPDNGMSFGRHRCHLVALGLQRPDARLAPLQAVADVFASHGIDPTAPYRTATG